MVESSAAGAVILSITYGYDVSDTPGNPDPLVKLAKTTVEEFSLAVAPGGFLVDFIPWCTWFIPKLTFSPHLRN